MRGDVGEFELVVAIGVVCVDDDADASTLVVDALVAAVVVLADCALVGNTSLNASRGTVAAVAVATVAVDTDAAADDDTDNTVAAAVATASPTAEPADADRMARGLLTLMTASSASAATRGDLTLLRGVVALPSSPALCRSLRTRARGDVHVLVSLAPPPPPLLPLAAPVPVAASVAIAGTTAPIDAPPTLAERTGEAVSALLAATTAATAGVIACVRADESVGGALSGTGGTTLDVVDVDDDDDDDLLGVDACGGAGAVREGIDLTVAAATAAAVVVVSVALVRGDANAADSPSAITRARATNRAGSAQFSARRVRNASLPVGASRVSAPSHAAASSCHNGSPASWCASRTQLRAVSAPHDVHMRTHAVTCTSR
jgi:hypothetical protein